MAKTKDSKSDLDAWENGEFGLDEAFIKVTDAAEAAEVDGALNLKMISIRLQSDLIKKLKVIAKYHGIGYQPLIRGQITGPATDLQIEAEEMIRVRKKLYDLIARHTGKDMATVEKDCDRNYWMDAQQCVDYGVVDKVLESMPVIDED